MKLTVGLIFFSMVTASAVNSYSQTARISLNMNNATVVDIFREIERNSEFGFFFKSEELNLENRKSIKVTDATIDEVLKKILDENCTYKIVDKNIVVTIESPNPSQQQGKRITGNVTDKSGASLPGVSIVVKGTTIGIITDANGNYSLSNVPENASLLFSFVGMKRYEIKVTGKTTLNVMLEEETIGIEEVVAIGYGTAKKNDLTGAIGSLNNKLLTVKGTATPMEALQGQIAGVTILAASGRAGTDFTIKIRGNNSLSGGDPLYVIDGIVSDNIQFVNQQDIERIDILKDASSTAIYGSRGSNGVVIVTTKQASDVKDQKPVFSYDGYYGVRSVARMPDFMNGDEWWKWRENAFFGKTFKSGGNISQLGQAWIDKASGLVNSKLLQERLANKDYTDWTSLFIKNGAQQNHWFSVSGKSANNISYVLGLGYQKEDGNIIYEWFDRYNFKASINDKISEKWTVGTNINFVLSTKELGSGNAIQEAFRMSPLASPYGAVGYSQAGELLYQPAKYEGISFTSSVNPLWDQQEARDNTRNIYALGNIYLQYTPIRGLSFKTTLSPEFKTGRRGRFYGSHSANRQLKDPASDLDKNETLSYTWDNQLNFEKTVDVHHFNFMVLHSLYNRQMEGSSISVENLPFESFWYNLGSAPNILSVSSSYSKMTLASVIGRFNYSYQDKYMVTASLRADGSSKLASGHKWASFPSAALGWRISDEGFLHDVKAISNLKARLSYGYTGNNNISPYSTQMLARNQMYYDFGGSVANGFAPSGIANSVLTWEKTREWNFGLDFGFFKNHISGSVDIYDKLSKELLMNRKLPIETGWGSVTANVGSVSNKGVELMLNTVNIETNDLTWKTSFTFAKNVNAIEELYGSKEDDLGNKWFIGEPINVNYTYVFDGIWKADQAAEAIKYGQREGQARVKDLDNSGTIGPEDRVIIGTPDPIWTGSFSTSLWYKGFDLNASLFTFQGVQVYSNFHKEFTNMDDEGRRKLDINYYMADNLITGFNDSDTYPMVRNQGPYWNGKDGVGDYKDASFVKVKNISLGYTFNPQLLNKINLKTLRVYINVLNPFVFTKYDGFDPEWASASFGSDGNSSVTYQFGINFKF